MKTLIMTATVNTQGCAGLFYTDKARREGDYLAALEGFLKYEGFNIVFSENSNASLDFIPDTVKDNPRVELLTFDGNKDVHNFGKGHGENRSVTYALENSKFLKDEDTFFKVSGRYMSHELPSVINGFDFTEEDAIFEDIPGMNGSHVLTVFFGMRKKFYLDNISRAEVNDSYGRIFEFVMRQAIRNIKVKWVSPILYDSIVVGGSGSVVKRFPA